MALRSIGLIGAAIVGFALVAVAVALLFQFTSYPDLNALDSKVRIASAYKDTDVLIVGTSRTLYGMSPAVFDKIIADRTGLNLKSYNLSIPGASLVELADVIENYFATKPCCVKYLILEPDFSFLDILRQPGSPRAAQFLNVRNAYDLLQYIRHFNIQPVPELPARDYVRNILFGFALHYSHAGMVRSLFDGNQVNYRVHPNERGFEPASGSLSTMLSTNLEKKEEYDLFVSYLINFFDVGQGFMPKDKREAAEADYILRLVSKYQFDVFLSLIVRMRERGVATAVLRTPQVVHQKYALSFAAQYRRHCASGPPLMDFGNPRIYPELFAPANRIDIDHLNQKGAAIFSAMVANKLADLMDRGKFVPGQSTPCEAW